MTGFEAKKAGYWKYLIDDNDLTTHVESRKRGYICGGWDERFEFGSY